jgi:aryl-alcohol dehydrogenase-like predicted oxidoreductase
MDQRLLGRTGIRVSEIGFGGVEIGLPYGIGVKSKSDMLSEAEAVRLLHFAIDSGINIFDTARMYGTSELIMGRAFQDRRDRVIICTKCRHLHDSDGRLPYSGELVEIIETSLLESLAALQTGFIDIYILHQTDLEILDNDAVINTFLSLKKKGVIRATGVSTYSPKETKKAIDNGVWDVIQLPFNLMNQSHEVHFSHAAERDVGIMIRSVLLKGLLSEKGKNLHPELQDVETHLNLYEELLGESIPDLPTLAIRFALSFESVSSVLVGIDRLAYLKNSLAAADGVYLEEKTLARAKELRYPNPQSLDLIKWDKKGWLT